MYNVEKYVEQAIRSIVDQTYRNLEIIVVDDGSTDKTYEVVSKIALEDHRIKLFRNDQNLKQAKTSNFALSMSKGDYIARMDGDDISALDRIEKQVAFLESNIEFDLVGVSLIAIDASGKEIGKMTYYASQKIINKTLKYSIPVSHVWVARRSTYLELGGYRNLPAAEDYDFLLRMTSMSIRYTNLEDYFGYYVRLGREGNTVSLNGLVQLRLQYYVYSLFMQRKKNNSQIDSFSEEAVNDLYRVGTLRSNCYKLASSFLLNAIKFKANQKYCRCFFYTLMTFISIDMEKYLLRRFIYKIYLRIYSK